MKHEGLIRQMHGDTLGDRSVGLPFTRQVGSAFDRMSNHARACTPSSR